ncbi:MAG: DUF423 domain-containing protein [Ignavibacterium sp.]
MKEQKIWIIIAAIMGFLGVALGAIGGHIVQSFVSTEMLEIYKIGINYHFIHTIVILVIALSSKEILYKSLPIFLIGIILFSFSLYLYSLTGIRIFAIITPFGGISFLIGWIYIIVLLLKKEN